MRNGGSDFMPGSSDANIVSGSYITGSGVTKDQGIARFTGTDGVVITGSNDTIDDEGNILVSGSTIPRNLLIGQLPTGSAAVYGIAVTGSYSASLGLYGQKENSHSGSAVHIMAVLDDPSMNSGYAIALFGWLDKNRKLVEAWKIKEQEIESVVSSSAEILGTDPDGALAIGTVVGSNDPYTTAGSKLLSQQNDGVEKAYTDYMGQKTFCISPYGGASRFGYWTEYVSVTSGSDTLTVNQIPAGSQVYAVSLYMISSFQTGSEIWIGISGSTGLTEKWGEGIHPSASVTNYTSSMKNGWEHYPNNTPVCVSASILQGATSGATGSMRIEARYLEVVPASS